MTSAAKLPIGVPTPGNVSLRRAIGALDTILADVSRSLSPEATGFVSRLAALDERLDAGRIRDESMTFLLAGYDTTSNALVWTTHILSLHPEAQERAAGDESATLAAIAESMRLYPPVPIMLRDVVADDVLGGHRVRAGSVVACMPYLTHRHPGFWTDPEAFKPERFHAGAVENEAYLPFGVQPRACIGEHMARLWMKITLRVLLARFRFQPVPGMTVKPRALVTLVPRDGLSLGISRRSS
jgi:cytochrome P450